MMKLNLKDKKITRTIVGIAVIVGLVYYIISGTINKANNDYVSIDSVVRNLKSNIIDQKELILEVEDIIKKTGLEESKSIEIESILKQIESINCEDENKINENIKQLDKFNNKLDKMIDAYDNNNIRRDDIIFSNKIEGIKYLHEFINEIMFTFNIKFSKEFNESINKFPVNLVAKSKCWIEINRFTSIK